MNSRTTVLSTVFRFLELIQDREREEGDLADPISLTRRCEDLPALMALGGLHSNGAKKASESKRRRRIEKVKLLASIA